MPSIAFLCADLLFASKIRETARALGYDAVSARDPAGLCEAARRARLVILDLRRPDALVALDRLRADPELRDLPALGFCDHQRVEVMEEARRRGCTALPKGQFASELSRLLPPPAQDAAPGREAAPR